MSSPEPTQSPRRLSETRRRTWHLPPRSRSLNYALGAGLAALAVLLRGSLTPVVGTGVQYLTVFPAVAAATLLFGRGPGLLGAAVAVLAVEFWLVPPAGIDLSAGVLVRAGLVLVPAAFLGPVHARLQTARDAAERRAAADERFRRVTEVSTAIVWVTNARGEAVEDSPSWRAFTGLSRERGLGWGWLEAIHPDDRLRVVQEWKGAVARTRPWETRFRLVHHSGRYRHVDCRAVPVLLSDGTVREWVGMYVDVTEREQAEANRNLLGAVLQALNRTDELRPAVVETLRLIREATGFEAVGLRLRQGEDAPYFEYAGFPEEFVSRENFLCRRDAAGAIVRDAEGRPARECACGLVLSDGPHPALPCFTEGGSFWTNASSELLALPGQDAPRLNPRNGCIHLGFESVGLFPVRSGGEILGLLQLNDRRPGRFTPELLAFYETLAQNLGLALQRISAEDALRRSEEGLRRAQEIAHLGSWELDLSENRLTWSDEVYRIFGLDPGFGTTYEAFLEAVHPDDRGAVNEAYTRSLQENRERYEIEHRVIHGGTGQVRVVHEKCEHLRDASGRIVSSLGMVQDITERKKTEDALRNALEAAGAASRAKSDFLDRMSHEMRTPMNGIMGMTELCLMEPELPQRAREFLALGKESARGLLEMINDMLDIVGIEGGRAELTEKPFDVNASVRDLVTPLRHAAERKGVRLEYRPAGDLPPRVLGDEGRLRQVLTNLVANAVKFTDRGEISVAVGLADGHGASRFASRVSSEPVNARDLTRRAPRDTRAAETVRLVFTVSDTGIGIPPENFATVFDSFSGATRSTHARYGGTGLGLSIARQLVELMGGRIWGESEPGRGSRFQFTADFGLPEAASGRAAARDVPAPTTRSLRVLVAEDDPLNQLFARELLLRRGHEVVVASDGHETISVLSRDRFDVVLMDVQMPGLAGDEVTTRIRAGLLGDCPTDLPVIAVTAHALNRDRERFLAAGMDAYVSKPLVPDALDQILAEVAARRSPSRADGGTWPAQARARR